MNTQDVGQQTKQSGFFYGWIIVIMSMLAIIVVQGVYYSFSVFYAPLVAEFHTTRAAVALVSSIMTVATTIFALLGGYMVDKLGPRATSIMSAALMGAGLILASRATNIMMVYVGFGFLFGGAIGACSGPLQTTVPRWFVKKRGLAMGLVVTGAGIGGMVVPLLVPKMIAATDWRGALLILGIAGIVIVGLTALLVRKNPSDKGLMPLGYVAGASAAGAHGMAGAGGKTLAEALKMPQYWLLFFFFLLMAPTISMTMTHIVPFAMGKGIALAVAVTLITIYSGVSIVGRLGGGAITDKLGNKAILLVASGCFIAGMVCLWLLPSNAFFFIAVALVGLGAGISSAVFTLFVAQIFGVIHMGKIFSTFFIASTIGSFTAVYGAGVIFDKTGSYGEAFMIVAILAVVMTVLMALVKVPKAVKPAAAPTANK